MFRSIAPIALIVAAACALALAACGGRSTTSSPESNTFSQPPPAPGRVWDGSGGTDVQFQTNARSLAAFWDGFSGARPIDRYEWALGRTPGGTEVMDWTSVGLATSAQNSSLALEVGTRYYASVRAVDDKGNTGGLASSNGVAIQELLVAGPGGMSGSHSGPQVGGTVATGPTGPGGGGGGGGGGGSSTSTVGNPVATPGGGGGNGGGSGGNPNLFSSITRHGVTWTFDQPCPGGQFVNGDWWVVGPVEVISIFPQSQQMGGRVMHGSMINPDASERDQGYDSSMYASNAASFFVPTDNVALGVHSSQPLRVPTGQSLVSTISLAGVGALPQLRGAAVLTVLGQPAPADSFRPPYCGTDKSLRWNESSLDLSKLLTLPVQGTPPSWAEAIGWLDAVWLDHAHGWLGRYMHPADNMPDYGREMSDQIGQAALMLQLDVPVAQKRDLLVRLVQLGIDFYGIAQSGGSWPADGGHSSGRKFPILFAGAMLNDPAFAAATRLPTVRFGEDGQTFYVEQTSPGVYNYGHGGYTAADVGMPEWGFRHDTDPSQDHRSWTADNYRVCCTANCWVGWVLVGRMMSLQGDWQKPELFDYQDRFMGIEAQGSWTRSWSRWPEAMWDAYRARF